MKIGEAFPSKYLKAADLQGKRVNVTIANVALENIGDDEGKAVVYFQGKDKGMVLNKTNANMIVEIAQTEETNDWRGVTIALFTARVDFQGKRVDAIRVDYPAGAAKVAPKPESEADADDDGSGVPF